MQHDVEAKFQRALDHGRGKGGIGHGENPPRLADFRDGGKVGHLERRVGWRLHPDHAGFRPNRSLEGPKVRRVRIGHGKAGRAPAHALEQPPAPAIEVVGRSDMAALVQKLQQGCLGGQAGGKGKARHAAFKFRHGRLEGRARRIARARIFPAGVHAGRGLGEGRRSVDGRHHSAGPGIGLHASVHRKGCGPVFASALGHGQEIFLRK